MPPPPNSLKKCHIGITWLSRTFTFLSAKRSRSLNISFWEGKLCGGGGDVTKKEEKAGLTIDWLREECLDGMGGIRQPSGPHLYFPHIPTSDTKIDKSFSIPI